MPGDEDRSWKARREDVRLRGFSSRATLEQAIVWVDANSGRLTGEPIAAAEAVGRIVAEALAAPAELPPLDLAREDGYALRSQETVGAGTYDPLLLSLAEPGAPLRSAAAALVSSGMPLPPGADAVLPFGSAERNGMSLEVFGAVAEGAGVERRGQGLRAGTALWQAARLLQPQDAALLAALGIEEVRVIRRPRVRLVVPGPRGARGSRQPADANGPMLRSLVGRDGGRVEDFMAGADGQRAIGRALAAPGADVILVAGRSGTGPDDEAPLALSEVGALSLHGIAVRPGGSAGMGTVGAVPVVLLPGDPLACLCAYELFAGRLIRRLGGRGPALPHAVREVEVGRKIVSAVGYVDLCFVRLSDGRAEPVGTVEDAGLASSVRADGFVVVPAPLEGYAPGACVPVRLYDPLQAGAGTGGLAP